MGEPEFFCLGSSSSGNAYIFKFDGNRQIMIEAGFPWVELTRRAINQKVRISNCSSCLITHNHKDHCDGAKATNDFGINVYASKGTLNKIGIKDADVNVLHHLTPTYICPTIKVLPFLVDHDAEEPLGFVIRDMTTKENILFINDCKDIKADISKIPLDYVFIECNYSDQPLHIELSNAIKRGDGFLKKRYERILNAHLGLKKCRELLNSFDLKRCKGIFLMHLSDRNARENEMRDKISSDHPNCKVIIFKKEGGYC